MKLKLGKDVALKRDITHSLKASIIAMLVVEPFRRRLWSALFPDLRASLKDSFSGSLWESYVRIFHGTFGVGLMSVLRRML